MSQLWVVWYIYCSDTLHFSSSDLSGYVYDSLISFYWSLLSSGSIDVSHSVSLAEESGRRRNTKDGESKPKYTRKNKSSKIKSSGDYSGMCSIAHG